jgi:hypothetical protein
MKFIATVILVAGLLGFCSPIANAQSVTPNLITSGTNHTWTGVTNGTTTGGGFSGGSTPAYNASTNTIYFGYNQATVGQVIAINNALQGSGVQVGGYNYSWQYLNNSSTGGTLSSTISLKSPTGTTLESYNYAMNTIADGWRTLSGTQNFNRQYGLTDVGNLSISFTGKDARWWAGYYGPQVKDVNLSLKYTVDPCVLNPLTSSSCDGFNNIVTSPNIAAQSYAINQALNLSGAGVQINGFRYGYQYYVGDGWCASSFLGLCLNWDPSSLAVDVNVTSSTGSSLYTATHNHTAQNTGGNPSYSYVFPQQRLLSSMGNFSLTTRGVGTTALYSSWSNWQYTPDPCTLNPLSSTSCAGYAAAYKTQQCTANPLYAADCPGYAQAMFDQQCSANALSNPACPGYQTAYFTQQCSVDPLYATTCPGYQQAYQDQQCSIDPLYATTCSGYQAAYKTQQCNLNALYDPTCPGYAVAYKTQQCTANPLYATDCPGYAVAYKTQQCNLNALYDATCPGYAAAYKTQQCTISPLYATDCPGYAVAYKTQQCSLSALYATDCPGYEQAYLSQQCSINSLYSNQCPGYAVAYKNQQCTANPLYATDCPGYAVAYHDNQCRVNPLYMSDCPGYAAAYKSQQCTISPLYATDCPGYEQAYLNAECIKDSLYSKLCSGYATAYAIKYLVPGINSSAVNSSLSNTAAVKASDPTSVNTNGTVTTTPSTTGNSTVDAVISTPSTTSTTSASPAAVNSVVNTAPPAGANPVSPVAQAPQGGGGKDGGPQGGGKDNGPQGGGNQQAQNNGPQGGSDRPQPSRQAPSREQIAAKANAAMKEANDAKSMEQQKAVQATIIAAMGTPLAGFDAYKNSIVPDTKFYKPYDIYKNQINVDNRRNSRGLFGPSDQKFNEIIESQYNREK